MVFLTVAAMSGSSLAPTFASAQVASGEDRDLPASRRVAAPVTTVIGYLWAADSSPIPNATLRLRNVVTGRVERSVTSGEEGEFAFSDIEGGTYVVEYVDSGGRVLAVGGIFSIAPGETVSTFVRLAEQRRIGGVFMMIGSAAVTAAASLGVTGVAPPGPAGPGRPISPNR
jgi:Carboxypeptidase regulatory-like domain